MIRIFIALVPFILSLNANLNAAEDQSTVLITGSNRNIGFEFVKQFANKGWRVIATTRSIDSADELIEFSKENNNVIIEQLDITNDEHLRNLKKKYDDDVIDVLLNNAAYTPRYLSSFRGIDGVDHEATRKSFEVNTIGTMKVIQAFISNVEESDNGKIINVKKFKIRYKKMNLERLIKLTHKNIIKQAKKFIDDVIKNKIKVNNKFKWKKVV